MASSWKELTVVHVLLFISFLLSGLFINFVQLLLFIGIVRCAGNRRLFRSINYYPVYAIYAQLLFLADWWSGSTVSYYCDKETLASFGQEHAVILMNHHYELDWLLGWMVGDRGSVLGNCRVYVKKMLKYVPILGWAWGLSDTIFLERNWEKDQVILKEGLKEIQNYPDPVWVLLFPEGTRYTPEKYQAGKEFSESRNLPVLKHCLVPRSKGWSFTVANLESKSIPWVYDVTLFCEADPPPTLTSVLLGKSAKAHMYIRKFKLEDIPKDEESSAAWLQRLFITKDDLLEKVKSTGNFDGVEGCPSYPPVELPRRHFSLLVTLCVNLSVLYPLCSFLLSSGPWGIAITAVGFAAATAGIKYFLGLTQVAHGTSYGKK